MRFLRHLAVSIITGATLAGAAVASAPASAGATTTGAARIASLAVANLGKHACSINSLGRRAYGSSCTGNGGKPEYWCADFAKWVWSNAGVADTNELSPLAGSFYTYGLENRTLTGTPAVGDAAVFNYYGGGEAEHVAIVTAVNANGTIETVSGDWNGDGGTEAQFASTSTVTLNDPAYLGAAGTVPDAMGMTLSAFVAPVGVAVTPVVGVTRLRGGTTLTDGESIASPNGTYVLGLSETGVLSETAGGRVLWSTGTIGQPGDEAVLQTDGNFVVLSSVGDVLWATGTGTPIAIGSTPPAYYLSLSDNGRLALSGPQGLLWHEVPAPNVLPSATRLRAGEKLYSSNGLYSLDMQSDGNLVEYSAGRALWSTRTSGNKDAFAVMRAGGNIIVFTETGVPLWVSHTSPAGAGGKLDLSSSGELVLLKGTTVIWSNGV